MNTARHDWHAWFVTLAIAASVASATAQDTNAATTNEAPAAAAASTAPSSTESAAPTPPRPERGTQKLDESAFRIISERNIFNANRSGGQVRLASRRPVSIETFTLVGTMAYERGAFAFFEGSRSDYTKALKAGDVIAGHKVADVLADGVKLEADGKEIELFVGSQMRREDAGAWRMMEVNGGGESESGSRSYVASSYSSSRNGDSSRSNRSGRSSDYRSRRSGDSSSDRRTETSTKPAEAPAPSAAEQAAALKRLLERKEKE